MIIRSSHTRLKYNKKLHSIIDVEINSRATFCSFFLSKAVFVVYTCINIILGIIVCCFFSMLTIVCTVATIVSHNGRWSPNRSVAIVGYITNPWFIKNWRFWQLKLKNYNLKLGYIDTYMKSYMTAVGNYTLIILTTI